MKIAIDAGHGGSDSGAVAVNGVLEKDIVLAMAKKVKELMEAYGVDVFMTRTDDKFVGLVERAELANRENANYFVSIHANSAENLSAKGIETYAYIAGGEGEAMASDVQKQLMVTLGATNRGVKFANFSVLRNTNMPAILVETGFISNSEEANLLSAKDYQAKVSLAIAKGVANYLGIETNTTPQQTPSTDYETSFAKADIEYCMEKGILSKTDVFRPKDSVTREELAAVAARILKALGK